MIAGQNSSQTRTRAIPREFSSSSEPMIIIA